MSSTGTRNTGHLPCGGALFVDTTTGCREEMAAVSWDDDGSVSQRDLSRVRCSLCCAAAPRPSVRACVRSCVGRMRGVLISSDKRSDHRCIIAGRCGLLAARPTLPRGRRPGANPSRFQLRMLVVWRRRCRPTTVAVRRSTVAKPGARIRGSNHRPTRTRSPTAHAEALAPLATPARPRAWGT